MKSNILLSVFFLLSILFSCSETEQLVPATTAQQDGTDARVSAMGKKLKTPITSFTISGRTYEVEYNEAGLISLINAYQDGVLLYQYYAYYEGEQLVRADLVENGQVMSSNTNFQYDSDGNVIAYDYVSYFFPEFPEGLVEPKTVLLNADGRLASFESMPLTYDKKGNVIAVGTTSYTYDKNVNPLSVQDDLWLLLVEEPGYALYTLSPNNTTSVTYGNGERGVYINEYDKKKRLLWQSLQVNGATTPVISFEY